MTITVLDSTGATQTLDPPTQTTLAAILAKLSADPASQTTLAAILAKIEAAPATAAKQDALAALIGEVQASPTSNTLLDRLKAIQTALAGGVAVTGTVTANIGTVGTLATAAKQDTQITAEQAILAKLIAAPATEAKQDTQITALGGLTETAPASDTASSGINGRLQRIAQRLTSAITLLAGGLPAALGAGGGLKVDGSGTALPVSGTVTANIGTVGTLATAAKQPALGTAGTPSTDVLTVQGATNGTPQPVSGNIASGATDSGNPVKVGGIYNSTPPTLTNGQRGDLQLDANGKLIIASTNADPALGTNQTALNTAFGTTATSAATDDTGTWAFMALVKRLLGKTTTVEGTALTSGTRTATMNSGDLTNDSCRGAVIFLNTTASSGTGGLQLRVYGKDPISGAYFSMNAAPTAVTGNGQSGYVVYPGASTAAGVVVQATQTVLPRTFRIAVTHGDASSYTYSVAYSLIP